MQGWIKLHRKLLENPIVCKDSDHLAVWIYLLLNATHESYPALFQGKKIILEPGQLITGRKSISQKLDIDESKVQRILKLLKNEQQIEQRSSNQNRLITIVRWYEYQNIEQQNEQPVNNGCTTDEQRMNTNKNVKNDKNVKEDIYSSIPDQLHEPLKRFAEHRKKLKKPMSDHAIKLMIKKLVELSGGEIGTSIQILEQSILNGWSGVFPLKAIHRNQKEDPYTKIMREEMQNEQNGINGSYENNQSKLPELL